jgi:peroxiredoxin family protein
MDKVSFIVGEDSYEKFMMSVILGTTGAAMDTEMNFFFTFFGLKLLKKSFRPKVAGMPFPMKRMAAGMFKAKMKKFGMDDPWGLVKDAVEEGKLKLYACDMTRQMLGIKMEDMHDFVEKEPVGAASFLEIAKGGRIVSL